MSKEPVEVLFAFNRWLEVISRTPDVKRDTFATFILEGHTDSQWKGFDTRGEISWAAFKWKIIVAVLQKRVRNQMTQELNEFRPGVDMNVTKYDDSFRKFSHYFVD